MSEFTRTCPQGHSWPRKAAGPSGDGSVDDLCPYCAALADTLRPDPITPGNSAAAASAPRALPSVAGYEIEAELGRGGMGVVYRARQTSLRRLVALKMVISGPLASPAVLARFRTETEAVARLAHPNIVQIYETGEAAGHAFFSMEYVAGGTLADRTRQGPQPPREAAQLVATLAGAVEHAHAHGIVHRDLKPANVLLSVDGLPKIADFGLAKQLASESSQTYTGDVMGSPSYMAPEQARGATQQIGPACDVYALGAILYELLTGRPPFLGQDTMETLIQVLHEDPLPPRRLSPRVPRDLETIALKCLEKSPRLRYASAGALVDDLERFLANRPVLARPAGPVELALKWARRRPAVAALAVVVVASAATIISYGAWKNAQLRSSLAAEQSARQAEQAQRERAERNFRKALAAADRRLTRAGQDPQILLKEELAFYDEIRAEPGDDPQIRHERGMAARRAGDIHRLLGDAAQAERAYAEAIRTLSDLAAAAPEVTDYRRDLAAAHNGLAQLWQLAGRLDESEPHFRAGADLFEQLVKEDPSDVDFRRQLAVLLNNLAIQLSKQGRMADAEAAHERALAVRHQLATEFPDNGSFRLDESISLANLGALRNKLGRHDEALVALRESLALREALPASYSAEADFRLATAGTYNNLGVALAATGEVEAAAAAYGRSVAALAKLVEDYPTVPGYRSMLADAHTNLGLHELRNDRSTAAVKSLQAASAIWDELSREDPQSQAFIDSGNRVRRLLEELEAISPTPQPAAEQSHTSGQK